METFDKLFDRAIQYGEVDPPKKNRVDWQQSLLFWEANFMYWLQTHKGLQYGDKKKYESFLTNDTWQEFMRFRAENGNEFEIERLSRVKWAGKDLESYLALSVEERFEVNRQEYLNKYPGEAEIKFLNYLQTFLLKAIEGYNKKESITPINTKVCASQKELLELIETLIEASKTSGESQFSALQWATIFYYAHEVKQLESGDILTQLSKFMSYHKVTLSKKSVRNKYYEAKNRINKKTDYPITILKSLLPFFRENYNQVVAKVENDIIFLQNKEPD